MNQMKSYREIIQEKIDAEPQPEVKFLTTDEQLMRADEQYFVNNTDFEYLKAFEISDDLTPKERFIVYKLLLKHREQFVIDKSDPIGRIDFYEHKIDTGDHPPIKSNPYPVSEKQREIIEECIDNMLRQGVITPCVSAWSSPISLVAKREENIDWWLITAD